MPASALPSRRGRDRPRRGDRHPRFRRLAQPPRVRRRPVGGVRGADVGPAVHGRRHPQHGRGDPRGERRGAARRACEGSSASCTRQGTTTVEIKSGYGLSVARRGAAGRHRRVRDRRGDLPRRARRACRVRRRPRRLRRPRRSAPCSTPARRTPAGSTSSARPAPSPWSSRGASSTAGAARGLGVRVHASQLGPGEGVQLAVSLDAASVDHCTYLTDADVAALAGSSTVATLLPGVEFSTRQPYPDARRLIDAGVTVAIACDCNPGSSFTSSMPFCIAVAVRDMGMTPAEALWSATAGGAAALRRDDIGRVAVGARADLGGAGVRRRTCTWRTGRACRSSRPCGRTARASPDAARSPPPSRRSAESGTSGRARPLCRTVSSGTDALGHKVRGRMERMGSDDVRIWDDVRRRIRRRPGPRPARSGGPDGVGRDAAPAPSRLRRAHRRSGLRHRHASPSCSPSTAST